MNPHATYFTVHGHDVNAEAEIFPNLLKSALAVHYTLQKRYQRSEFHQARATRLEARNFETKYF